MRAWESAKDGTASQQVKTVNANSLPNLRVDISYLPEAALLIH
jgi:hypothetical protein